MVDKDKRAARELAERDGIPYARALRQARRQPRPPIPAEVIAALAVDPAAGYAADDWSWEARSAPKKETGTNRGRANPRCPAGVEECIAGRGVRG